MKIEFSRQFNKDVQSLLDSKLKVQLQETIVSLENAASFAEIAQAKFLSGQTDCARIRIRNHRLGIRVFSDRILLARFLHRKEIYRKFP